LRSFLRRTAEAMTTFGTESIPHDELKVRLGLKAGDLRERAESLSGEAFLARLMISFFFKGGRTELGVEFSHKSFREYLFAELLLEELKAAGRDPRLDEMPERPESEYWRDFADGDPRQKFCHRLADLMGPVWMSPEVSLHLQRLLD